MKTQRVVFCLLGLAMILTLPFAASAQMQMGGPESKTQYFKLSGTVKSVNAKDRQLVVQHGDIPGFMSAMTMPYHVGKSEDLQKIAAGDRIQADVVVKDNDSHLENIKVTSHEKSKDK